MGRVRLAAGIGTVPPKSLVPWLIEDSDLVPADPVWLARDVVTDGQPQKQLAFQVSGQYVPALALMAVRCERRQTSTGEELTPLSVAWPCETELPDDTAFQSGGSRAPRHVPDTEDDQC